VPAGRGGSIHSNDYLMHRSTSTHKSGSR
jgi:hypothetical protein